MENEKIIYEGACHCGAVSFRFKSKLIDKAMWCNCSICIRKNAIMSIAYFPPEDFELITGSESLSVYKFGDNDVNHYFCKTCGIYPFHDSVDEPGRYRVNLGCVESIDPRELPIKLFDGKNLL